MHATCSYDENTQEEYTQGRELTKTMSDWLCWIVDIRLVDELFH